MSRCAAPRRAATRGDGWFPSPLTPDRLAVGVAKLRELAAEHGRPTPNVTVGIHAVLGTDQAVRSARDALVRELVDGPGMSPEQAATIPVTGSPEQAAERFAAYATAGADRLVIAPTGRDWMRLPGLVNNDESSKSAISTITTVPYDLATRSGRREHSMRPGRWERSRPAHPFGGSDGCWLARHGPLLRLGRRNRSCDIRHGSTVERCDSTGEVIGNSVAKGPEASTAIPIVRFTGSDGEVRTVETETRLTFRKKVGSRVTVLVDADNQDRVAVEIGWLGLINPVFFLTLGTILVIAAFR